jgi:hypothetical protein
MYKYPDGPKGPSQLREQAEAIDAKMVWHLQQADALKEKLKALLNTCTHRFDDGKPAGKGMYACVVCVVCNKEFDDD